MEPENRAIEPPKPPKVDAFAVAANDKPSSAYIGKMNAAKALRIAAANKYRVWMRWIMGNKFWQSWKKIGFTPPNSAKLTIIVEQWSKETYLSVSFTSYSQAHVDWKRFAITQIAWIKRIGQ